MILSSADILRILGGSEIIRLSAKLKVVDGKPALSGAEGLFIFIDRFPSLEEFEATWKIWIESDGSEPDDLVLAEIKKLLPKVQVRPGLMTEVSTTDFRSESTQRAPEAPKAKTAQVDLSQYEERFQALVEDVQDQMLLVTSGRPGKDGQDGRDGVDGRDGRDLQATEVELEELANVESNIAKENGQVLTWKDGVWQNLFIPQIISSISPGGGGGGTTINQLNDIGDVDVPTPSHGDVLTYNSSSGNWVNSAAPPADISGNSIDDLSDVDTSTSAPTLNQALVWDGSNWVPGDVASNAPVDSVNGQTGIVVLDADAIDDSTTTNKFATEAELTKLAGIADGAEVNVNADWNATSGDAEILNKPVLGTAAAADTTDFATAAQGALADSALQPGDNVSELVNDANYITQADLESADADGGYFGDLPNPDGGDFDDGSTTSLLAYPVDGGNFDTGTSEAYGDSSFSGGEAT